MGLISLNLTAPAEKRATLETPSVSLGNIGAIWSWISGTEPTASGELIDEHVALQIVSVYSCIRLLAETVSSLPLKLYERLPKGRREAIDNDLYYLLTTAPNPEMSAVPFWESVVGCMALCGNSYVYIQRSGSRVLGLWPLNPKKTLLIRLPDGSLGYKYSEGQAEQIFNASDILHFKLFSWDGLVGLSPIHLARQGLGLSRAAEKMGARLFANGGRPSGVMTTDMNLDERTLLNIRESWQASQSGENSLKTAFIPGNWKYTAIGLDMESVEFLSTRSFQRAEVASLFRVPAHLIGDTTRQSNTNNEQESLSLVTLTLRPYLTRIENEIQRVLLPSVGRKANRFFAEFDVRALLRGDFKTAMEGYAIGKQWGFFNSNHILEDLGLNPIGPTGEVYWCPVNMQNAEVLLKQPEETPAPAPAAEPAPNDQERSIVQRASSLTLIFRDAVGRLTHRDQRDLQVIRGVFEPCLRSILALSMDDANRKLGVQWADEKGEERIIQDACKGIEKRCTDWTPEAADAVAGDEFRKSLKSIVAAVYREAAAASVVGE